MSEKEQPKIKIAPSLEPLSDGDKKPVKIKAETPVGETLKNTRIKYDQTIYDIESALRIRAAQITAIEQNDTEAMPAKVYTLGFIRTYADYLGLDGEEMVAKFKTQSGIHQEEAQPKRPMQKPVLANENQLPPWWLILLCILGAAAMLVFWLGDSDEERQRIDNIPPVPESIRQTTAPEPPKPASPAEKHTVKAPPVEKGIILNVRENSWVEIRDKDDKALISRVLEEGEQYFVPDRPDLTISMGNAGGIAFEVDGIKLKDVGQRGAVVKKLSLDTEYLKKEFAPEPLGPESVSSEPTDEQ